MPDMVEPGAVETFPDAMSAIAKEAITGNVEAKRVLASLLALDIIKTWLIRKTPEVSYPGLAEAYEMIFLQTWRGINGNNHE